MIISRAAAAELLVLAAGLGKGHVQLGAHCIPWGHWHGGSPGCCPGWHPAGATEAEGTELPECWTPAGRFSSSLLFLVSHPLHVGSPGDGHTPKLTPAPTLRQGGAAGAKHSPAGTLPRGRLQPLLQQGLCSAGRWDRVPREMALEQWRV